MVLATLDLYQSLKVKVCPAAALTRTEGYHLASPVPLVVICVCT